MNTPDEKLVRVVEALKGIGLEARFVEGASGFVPNIAIEAGVLLVDPRAQVSSLLHEAGHLASVPARFRHYVGRSLSAALKRMWEEVEGEDPEGPLCRAVLQCSDPEATAWAYAFGTHLGFAPEVIILDSEYDNTGEDIRASLVAHRYIGINGLAAAGFCAVNARVAAYRNLPAYPKMAFWTQEL